MTLVINNVPSNVTRDDIGNFVKTKTGYSVSSITITDSRVDQGVSCVFIIMRDTSRERYVASLLNGEYWGSHKITTGVTRSDLANSGKQGLEPKTNTLLHVLVATSVIVIGLIVVFAIIRNVPVQIVLSIIGGGVMLVVKFGSGN